MISNLELYGTEKVPPIPKEIALGRIELLKANLETIDIADSGKTKLVVDAIKFWQRLGALEEVGI